jgi:hypothetical protein
MTNRGILCSILQPKHGNCSNDGISARVESVVLLRVTDGPFEPSPTHPGVRLVERRGLPTIAVPVEPGPEGWIGPMFGGCWIYTSDSRFGCSPIALHDRYESPALYASMSD